MGVMPKKKTLTVQRVLALVIAYITLCVGGGVVTSIFFMPAVFAANNAAKAVIPSLAVEGIDFDVTSLPQRSTMYFNDGKTAFAEFYTQNREVVPLKKISKAMQQAVVAREDKRFFEHTGVDVQGVFRAFFQTYVRGGDQQGGSTLTQQYVKNVLSTQAREDDDPIAEYHATEDTVARKLREMLISVQIEKKYSKAEILQGYLNIAQFGRNNLCGVEMAAKRYFNVSASELNVIQAATIAAITKNPQNFDPSVEANQKEAEHQRNIVLQLMHDQGYITSEKEFKDAINTPLKDTLNLQDVSSGCQSAIENTGFFCSYVVNQILKNKAFGKDDEAREKLLKEGGLKIVTTLDRNANNAAMQAANSTVPATDPSGFEVMIAAVKPGTGEILSFGINRTYDATDDARTDETKTSMNYMVDQEDGGGMGFNVGSTWKPINMVAWMQKGHSINESLVTSTVYDTSKFKSHNTTQASMASNIGLCAIADAAKEMGYHNAISNASDIYSANSFQPPMTIGTVQASPLTMANVYATMGANGVECTPIAITKVTDRSGSKVKVPSANCHQAIDPDIAQTVSYALNRGVVQPGGEASTTQLDNNRKTFAKTGTNENTVMTTAGFVPNQVAAFVAVADAQDPINNTFDNKTINGVYRPSWYGMYIATPAWKQFMNTYLAAINAPIDNDYGKGADKYTVSKGATRTYNQYQYQRQQNSQQQSQQQGQQQGQQQTNQGQQQQSQQQPAEQQSDQQHQ